MTPSGNELIEALFREYYSLLLRYAIISLQNADLAQDVVQDVFHEALKHQETLATHDNPGGWLMQTLKNKLRECKRQLSRMRIMFQSLEELPNCSLLNEDREVGEGVDKVMDRIKHHLSEDEFYLLRRIVFDEASHLEVSKELNITVWTSQKRLTRIRDKLLKLYPDRTRKKKQTINSF